MHAGFAERVMRTEADCSCLIPCKMRLAYGVDLTETFRRAAVFVDKILKGAPLRELPVEQPTRFKLVLNLKSAKVLGLEFPPTLLARADEVIE
jgi:putative tryptophan/tyrosine transport system substrate-binding protein